MDEVLLKCEDIYKNFGGTQALDQVDFELLSGEVHALIGQNGAGKSTFSRIISGDIQKNSGKIFINGIEKNIKNCIEAKKNGICMIYQELRLIPYLTVAENILLNQYEKYPIGLINWKKTFQKSEALMERWDIKFNPKEIVSNLPISQQQLVEILKNLSVNPKILIMDEPTSSLGHKEIKSLFEMINYVKNQGVAIIYISHILDEVFSVSDRITIFRDGKNCGTFLTKKTIPSEIIQVMLNENIRGKKEDVAVKRTVYDEVLLEVKDLNRKNVLNNISFKLHKGEILGITGLMGSGKTELARGIVGLDKINSGEISISNKKINIKSIRDAIKNGLSLIPEDRRQDGIFNLMTINDNIAFLVLEKVKKIGLINSKRQKKLSMEYSKNLQIKFTRLSQLASELSGGNQQKVVVAKWLATKPKILIADEPTRGIDIGTKKEIYELLKNIANTGIGIILLSEEIDEILNLSDRILVLNRGKIIDEFEKNNISKEELVKSVSGLKNKNNDYN
jgi:ABC-type sugar transport system, ATPase component